MHAGLLSGRGLVSRILPAHGYTPQDRVSLQVQLQLQPGLLSDVASCTACGAACCTWRCLTPRTAAGDAATQGFSRVGSSACKCSTGGQESWAAAPLGGHEGLVRGHSMVGAWLLLG